MIQVIIFSQNEILREGLRRILEDQGFNVEQTVSKAAEVTIDRAQSGIFLVEGNHLDSDLSFCRDLRDRFPNQRIALIMDNYSIEDVINAFATRAVDGYFVKAISCEPLAASLRLIAMGEKVLPSELAESLCNNFAIASPGWTGSCVGANLSNREVEILRCLVAGESNKVISRRLSIADATVKVHIKAILRKLLLHNRTQAAIWAVQRGLTAEPPSAPPVISSPARVVTPPQIAVARQAAI